MSLSQISGKALFGNLKLNNVPKFPGTSDGAYDLGKIKSGMTLPRNSHKTDKPDEDGIYHYKVDKIKLSGSDTLTINPPNEDEEVYLYVSGDVTLNGGAAIDYKDENSTIDQFRIYGTGTGLNQEYTLNGTPGGFSGFVYAPNATVGINGNGQWEGIVWADKWDGSKAEDATLDSSMVSKNAKKKLMENLTNVNLKDLKISTVNYPTNWKTIKQTKKEGSNNS